MRCCFTYFVCFLHRQQFPTCDGSESVCNRQQLSICDDTKGDLWLLFFLLIGKYLCDILRVSPICDGTYSGLCVCLQLECSGHGKCTCNKCYCDAQYIGPTCDDCPVSTSVLPVAIAQ